MEFRNALVLTGCLTAATLSFAAPCASAGVLVGSLLGGGGSSGVVADNVLTRTSSGNMSTRGQIGGTFDAVSGSTTDTFQLANFSGSTLFQSLPRHLVLAYDFHLSGYLADHRAGNNISDTTYALSAELSRSDTFSTFYLSYNDGSSISLDQTDVAGLSGDWTDLQNLVGDTSHYIDLGHYSNGVTSVDITDALAASTDGHVRIAMVHSWHNDHLQINGSSGIVASPTVVVPEPSVASLLLLGAGVVLVGGVGGGGVGYGSIEIVQVVDGAMAQGTQR